MQISEAITSKYATPNDFIRAYLELRLREAEKLGIQYDDSAKHGIALQSTADNWWNFVDKQKDALNDFLEGKYQPSIGLQLKARLATIPESNLDPTQFMDLFTEENGVGELINWAMWLSDNEIINFSIDVEDHSVKATVSNAYSNSIRTRIVRHSWYDQMGINIDFREYEDISTALILALIASYDHGIWDYK